MICCFKEGGKQSLQPIHQLLLQGEHVGKYSQDKNLNFCSTAPTIFGWFDFNSLRKLNGLWR